MLECNEEPITICHFEGNITACQGCALEMKVLKLFCEPGEVDKVRRARFTFGLGCVVKHAQRGGAGVEVQFITTNEE
jgi:hypothetical protein